MYTQQFHYFHRSINSQIVKICLPIASIVFTTSVWAGYNPPPEQDPPKDPTGSTSMIMDMGH